MEVSRGIWKHCETVEWLSIGIFLFTVPFKCRMDGSVGENFVPPLYPFLVKKVQGNRLIQLRERQWSRNMPKRKKQAKPRSACCS